jgi:hypothetical protein
MRVTRVRKKRLPTMLPMRFVWRKMHRAFIFWFHHWLLLLISFVGIGCIIFGVYMYYISSFFQIKHIDIVRSQNTVDIKNIEPVIKHFLLGKRILAPEYKYVEAKIYSIFPDIENITFTKKLPDTLEVSVARFHLWGKVATNLQEAFYINTAGYAQKYTGEVLSPRMITLIFPKMTQVLEETDVVLSPNEMLFLDNVWEEFFEYTETLPEYIEFYPISRSAIVKSSAGYDIWMTLTKSYKEQLQKFKHTTSVFNAQIGDFVYIDIRPKNRFILCRNKHICHQNKQRIFLEE